VTEHFHAIVWIDHQEARVLHFNADEANRIVVHPHHATRHIHHKAHATGSGHAAEDPTFFHDVVAAIAGSGRILITGPANAKHELAKHIQRHDPKLMARVAAVETLDHPTDGALLAHARKFFKADDRMESQRG
jgi:stalled ribosome rescue protein Dom34